MSREAHAALSPNATAVLSYALAHTYLNADNIVCVRWHWPLVREACGLTAYDDADRYGDKAMRETIRPAVDELITAGFIELRDEGRHAQGNAITVFCD